MCKNNAIFQLLFYGCIFYLLEQFFLSFGQECGDGYLNRIDKVSVFSTSFIDGKSLFFQPDFRIVLCTGFDFHLYFSAQCVKDDFST